MLGRLFRRYSIFRSLLPLFMLTYLLLLMLLLLKVNVESPRAATADIRSSSAFYFYTKEMRVPLTFMNQSHGRKDHTFSKIDVESSELSKNGNSPPVTSIRHNNGKFPGNTTIFPRRLIFQKPKPISTPLLGKTDSFYTLHDDVFIFSAYYDDRKEDVYIRILILASQTASRSNIYCHFQDDIYNIKRTATRYEMCENHNRKYGGYIFSCQVPEFLNHPTSSQVNMTYNVSNNWLIVPVKTIRPPPHKLNYLNSYIGDRQLSPFSNNDIFNDRYNKVNIMINNNDNNIDKLIKETTSLKDGWKLNSAPPSPLSFAICVPPLFGKISPYRLIEFVEFSLLLGAQHIFFYSYSISDDIPKVLTHYVSKGVVTVTPWTLPRNMTSDRVWYNGQLLAHNDCLYRTMPDYDLVAFNDIDEFIVPHGNFSTIWSHAFPKLLTNRTCGFSFQSAFYDPGAKITEESDLLSLSLRTRTRKLSKVRSKVMLCPWRVFEVGIHHISKQNKEMWTVTSVDPPTAFLHHYRRCVVNYDMSCRQTMTDEIVTKRYRSRLKKNYDAAIATILPKKRDTLYTVHKIS